MSSITFTKNCSGFSEIINILGKFVYSDIIRQIEYLKVENTILRSKLGIRIKTTKSEKRKLIKYGKPLKNSLKELISIASYSTFRRWVKIQENFTESNPKVGRPRITTEEIRQLIIQMASDNAWGYTRILGELKKLRIKSFSRNTVRNILIEYGFNPAPKRGKDTWNDFINRHFETLWACDFFTKTVWTILGPKTFYILFFINVNTRKVFIAGLTQNPTQEWVIDHTKAIAHIFETDKESDIILVRDGDKKFSKEFNTALKEYDVNVFKIPFRAPNMNPYAEGWVGTVKRECLNHFIVLGVSHLKHLITEFVDFYNTVRPHSSLKNNPLDYLPDKNDGEIKCDSELGGVLRHYYRE
ncbi:integrase core domain-containing protein [Candidatus Pacearchaeota archaeon]|nr:integrase core domain-containing protein [Candidatus Pacearchaeota archaeon]